MKYRLRRHLWPRRVRRRSTAVHHKKTRFIWIPVVLGVGLALLTIHMFDHFTRPLIIELAFVNTDHAVNAIVNRAVQETMAQENFSYDDIITLQTDETGRVTAMTTNTVHINLLRVQVLDRILEETAGLSTRELGIPMGNLTGIAAASGQGPMLPVQVLSAVSPGAVFRNVFTDAGINQTLHQIMLEVPIEIRLLIPGGIVTAKVETQVCVAETIIVGEVPSAYLQVAPSATP